MAKNEFESKESMQNTIKSLQARSENIEKLLEKGNDVIVLQFGSHSLRYGLANQMNPYKIRTLIGYTSNAFNENKSTNSNNENLEDFENACNSIENFMRKKGNLKLDVKSKGKPRPRSEVSFKIHETEEHESTKLLEKRIIPEFEPSASSSKNSKINLISPDFIKFERDIFLNELTTQDFIISQPIKFGMFNISDTKSQEQVLNELQALILYVLNKKLSIPSSQFKNYSIILIIPDLFIKSQIKGLINIFLRDLEFKYIYLHLESVMACFGACLSQACVVDIGHQKINVSCVDEGLILPNTTIKKNFGGNDLDHILLRLLSRKHQIIPVNKAVRLDSTNFGDLTQIEKIKEECSSFTFKEEQINRYVEGSIIRQGANNKPFFEKFLILPNESYYISAYSLFLPEILNIMHKLRNMKASDLEYFNVNSKLFENYYDPEDNLDDNASQFIQGTFFPNFSLFDKIKEVKEIDALSDSSKNTGSKIKIKLDLKNEKNEENQVNNDKNNPFLMEKLEELICYSISQIKDSAMRKKMAMNILLIGGGSQINKIVEELEDRLIEIISKYDNEIESVEVIDVSSKEIISENLSWVGGSILAKLDSIKNLWITRNRWLGLGEDEDEYDEDGEKKQKRERTQEVGVKYLKEKVPFMW